MDCRSCDARGRLGPRPVGLPAISLASLLLLGIASSSGCSWFGGTRIEQYQAENQRLIEDFRLQRDRSSQLERQNQTLESRVAELENRLAIAAASAAARVAERRSAEPDEPSPSTSQQPNSQSPISQQPAVGARQRPPASSVDPWRARPL